MRQAEQQVRLCEIGASFVTLARPAPWREPSTTACSRVRTHKGSEFRCNPPTSACPPLASEPLMSAGLRQRSHLSQLERRGIAVREEAGGDLPAAHGGAGRRADLAVDDVELVAEG